MKGTVDAYEELIEEFYALKATENVKIHYLDVYTPFFETEINNKSKFELADKESYEADNLFVGHFDNIPVYLNDYIDDGYYDIKNRKLYELCSDCLVKKMYDEKNKVHYCPVCDDFKQRVKDKFYNLVR